MKALAATTAVPAMGMNVEAKPADSRFLIDTKGLDDGDWKSKGEVVWDIPELNLGVVRAPNGTFDETEIRASRDLRIEAAPPDPIEQSEAEPEQVSGLPKSHQSAGAPHPFQWDKKSQQVEQLHNQGITGDGASIAIIDSGVSPDHPDLIPNINIDKARNYASQDSYPIDPSKPHTAGSHGTHVAGIAASSGANSNSGGPYVVGVAPDAEIIPIKVLGGGSTILTFLSDLFRAIVGAASPPLNADVANMSLGTYNLPGPVRTATILRDLYVDLHVRAAEYAHDQGMVLVAAAGNSDTNLDEDNERLAVDLLDLPAEVEGFMSISATGPFTSPSNFDPSNPEFGDIVPYHGPAVYTNYGPDAVDLSAAGGNGVFLGADGVLSTVVPGKGVPALNGNYAWFNGTSMASPQVAGAAALVAAENPDMTPQQIRHHLENTGKHVMANYPNIQLFSGYPATYLGSNAIDSQVGDFELEDPYTSPTYRGEGHLDISRAATKDYPDALEGGIEMNGRTYYPADPDDDGLYEDVRGDTPTDMDGVDMKDVQMLYQLVIRNEISEQAFAPGHGFDFNGDGRFDMRDVQALIDKID